MNTASKTPTKVVSVLHQHPTYSHTCEGNASVLTDLTHSSPLPVGGGNVLNVQRTVRQLINVGAKGCFLEDQRWPKRTGIRNKEVISMDEFAAKVGSFWRGRGYRFTRFSP